MPLATVSLQMLRRPSVLFLHRLILTLFFKGTAPIHDNIVHDRIFSETHTIFHLVNLKLTLFFSCYPSSIYYLSHALTDRPARARAVGAKHGFRVHRRVHAVSATAADAADAAEGRGRQLGGQV